MREQTKTAGPGRAERQASSLESEIATSRRHYPKVGTVFKTSHSTNTHQRCIPLLSIIPPWSSILNRKSPSKVRHIPSDNCQPSFLPQPASSRPIPNNRPRPRLRRSLLQPQRHFLLHRCRHVSQTLPLFDYLPQQIQVQYAPPRLRNLPVPRRRLHEFMPNRSPRRLPTYRLRPILPQRIRNGRSSPTVRHTPLRCLFDHQSAVRGRFTGEDVSKMSRQC